MDELKRRTFLKNSLLTGIGSALNLRNKAVEDIKIKTYEKQHFQLKANAKKIIVGGAGISGLCCAYELMKKGHDVIVMEASGRHGGHIFTGRDGLSEGLYADFGADHITKPGYEKVFEYINEFKLEVISYPNAEGSEAAIDNDALRMINGKFYSRKQLNEPTIISSLGFNEKETSFLSVNPWYKLPGFFLNSYLDKFKDEMQPFGIGYDEYDKIPITDIFKKEGASATAIKFLGGHQTSALYYLWRMAIMKMRGIPESEGDTFHIKGGNQELPTAFARSLGKRVLLNHPILSLKRNESGVSVTYKEFGYKEEKNMNADYFVNTIPISIFKTIRIEPALSKAKQYVIDNLSFSSHPFYVFEASSKFWIDDGLKSINMEFEHPDISSIWMETNDVSTSRIILKAYGPGGLSPQRVLAAFRSIYPGKKDTIVQGLTVDWTKDKFAPACEMEPMPLGKMHQFWPEIIKPDGRIYFSGTYADNLSRGMESCVRSAQRIANEIDKL